MNDVLPVVAVVVSVATFLFCLSVLGKVNALSARLDRTYGSVGFASNPATISDRVRELAREPGRKIEAIKALREETGLGLAESKRIVEELARNG